MSRPNVLTKFRELVDVLVLDGTLKQANTIDALERLVSSLTDEIDRDCCSGELAIGLGRIGNFAEADRIIGQVEHHRDKADYWLRLAEEQFKAGEREGALNSLRRSEEVIDSLRADFFAERADVLSHKAKLLDDFELPDQALFVWNRAIEVAQSGQVANPSNPDCSAILANMAGSLAESGRLQLARSVADSIGFPGKRELAHNLIDKASQK